MRKLWGASILGNTGMRPFTDTGEWKMCMLTLTMLVATIDALGHFETG